MWLEYLFEWLFTVPMDREFHIYYSHWIEPRTAMLGNYHNSHVWCILFATLCLRDLIFLSINCNEDLSSLDFIIFLFHCSHSIYLFSYQSNILTDTKNNQFLISVFASTCHSISFYHSTRLFEKLKCRQSEILKWSRTCFLVNVTKTHPLHCILYYHWAWK